jgi:hypothetical protein
MKNSIKWFLSIAVLGIIDVSCTDSEEYKKYLKGGEIVYPQKAYSVKTFPGKNRIELEWVLTNPRVVSCDVFYEQSGIKDSVKVDVSSQIYFNDTIHVIISNLEETTYIFKIISHDEFGNSSVVVEEEGSVYGEIYEDGLVNRVVKSKKTTAEGLEINWYDPDTTEVAVKIQYADWGGNRREVTMPRMLQSVILPDCDITQPFYYQTQYKPVPEAIDIFYAKEMEDIYVYAPAYPVQLLNAEAPFATNPGWNARFSLAKNWIANDPVLANGNVDSEMENAMIIWAFTGYSPVESIINGKVYQILSLSQGTYSFNATLRSVSSPDKAYVAVSEGTMLPDIERIEIESLSYQEVVDGMPAGTVLKCRFTLSSGADVSVGIIANVGPAQNVVYSKFELKKE